jgi:uncharacterized membrane protein
MSKPASPLISVLRLGGAEIPLYSIVAPFPVSFFLGVVVFDSLNAAGIWSQGGSAAHGAYNLIIAGFIATALWLPLMFFEIRQLEDSAAKKTGLIGLVFLISAAMCFVLSFALRPTPKLIGEEKIPDAAFICSIIGGLNILIASRIGSHMVYMHRLGVSKPKAVFPDLTPRPKRHPLHILFAHLPLGLWFMSIVFDVYANWGQNREPWVVKAAYMCVVTGCASALCAIVTGFIDWLLTHEEHPAQPWAIFHMLTTMAGTACFIFGAGLRWKQINYLAPQPNVILLSCAGFLAIFVGSIVGMRLVYKNNVTVTPAIQADRA